MGEYGCTKSAVVYCGALRNMEGYQQLICIFFVILSIIDMNDPIVLL